MRAGTMQELWLSVPSREHSLAVLRPNSPLRTVVVAQDVSDAQSTLGTIGIDGFEGCRCCSSRTGLCCGHPTERNSGLGRAVAGQGDLGMILRAVVLFPGVVSAVYRRCRCRR